MDDYISREALIEHLDKCKNDPLFDPDMARICFAISIFVENMKAADVQLIKKGHWYHNTSKYISELDAYFIQACCSCCGKYSDRVDLYSTIMSNEMCSHCGARMIKGGDIND